MVTENFFDLQRFDEPMLLTATNAAGDKDTLSNNGTQFTWKGGGSFAGSGSAANPAYLSTAGASAIAGTEIYLNGRDKDGYEFAIDGTKKVSFEIKGSNAVRIGEDGIDILSGSITAKLEKGGVFEETISNGATYVRAGEAADVNVAANGNAMTYTVNDNKVAVVLDSNDTLFTGAVTDITLGAATSANADAASINSVNFGGAATVTSDGTNINIAPSGSVNYEGDTWRFDNKSTRDTSGLVIGANGEITSVAFTKGATVNTDGLDNAVNINGTTWNQIAGDVNMAIFDADGNATVNNTFYSTTENTIRAIDEGTVTVSGAAEKTAQFATVTAEGVVANGVKIQSSAADDVKVTLEAAGEGAGIAGIKVDLGDVVTVTGDQAFDITANKKTYNVSLTADDFNFMPNNNRLNAVVVADKAYTIAGGDAVLNFAGGVRGNTAEVSINSADVKITNGSATNTVYLIGTDAKREGVNVISNLTMGDANSDGDVVSVSSDNDGYTAIFTAATTINDDSIVSFAANGATISVKAGFVDSTNVSLIADNANNVTVQGIEGDAIVSVAGSATYHFKNASKGNTVKVTSGAAYTEVTLTGAGDVSPGNVKDAIDDKDQPRVQADQNKWDDISTVGGAGDTVATHHASVYSDFYNLAGSNISNNTVAGYLGENDSAPTDASSNINIIGESPLGTPAPVGEAAHVTLTGDSNVGNVPINIQTPENPNAVDVTVSLTSSNSPSTVSVGTTGNVSVSHNIQLSNAGSDANPNYGYLGQYATGQNTLAAGTASAMLRHDGSSRATILGNTGNDTIRGDVNDVVTGGTGVDYFYDISGYATDYNVAEGDVIIASRLSSLNEITASAVRGTGNQIGFGNGVNLLTLANIDPTSTVHVKVGVMDNDGNIVKGIRDVVLANGNSVVDATAAGTNGAIIVANAGRDDSLAGSVPQVHQVIGSEGNDQIYVGAYDAVSGALGDDYITIDKAAPGVTVALSAGSDSVTGWTFGFDRATGATQLNAGGAQVVGRVLEDRLLISLEGSNAAMSFEDTKLLGGSHGQYNVLIDGKKYTAIRNGDSGQGYAIVTSNEDIADYYLAEREGTILFASDVTQDLGLIDLNSQNYQYIRNLTLWNSSKAVVLGSEDRETVNVSGAASIGANKFVSLGAGNDVIVSGGDGVGTAGNTFYFGTGDGRDTITNFGHYLGVLADPDKQQADTIVLNNYAGLKAEVNADGTTRIEFDLGGDNEYALIYETEALDPNAKMYRVAIGDGEAKTAKIGYSAINAANDFIYDKEVSYYVGASGKATDRLIIGQDAENVEIWLDNSKDKYYRGIGVVDASLETNTNISIAGSADNNVLIAGNDGTRNFLWGGAGDNSLIGGTGIDYFLYYKGSNVYTNGANPEATGNNDVIYNYNENTDFIYLGDVTIDDINVAAMSQRNNYGITENAVTVDLNNGGSLTVNVTSENDNIRFWMNDGSVYTASRETGAWKQERQPGPLS